MSLKEKFEGKSIKLTLILAAVQIVFAIAIAATTAIQLDGQDVYVTGEYAGVYGPTNYGTGYCVLNDVSTIPPGRVCDFVYITVGFGIFFSLLLAIPSVLAITKWKSLFLDSVVISHSLFAGFWWLVLAVTITIRGGQADDADYPKSSQRTAVIALSWLEFIFFFFIAVLGIVDRVRYTRYKKAKNLTSKSEVQFRETHRATQVLGATPIA